MAALFQTKVEPVLRVEVHSLEACSLWAGVCQ